jgi:hypothetical protein
MASYTDAIPQFNPYIQQLPVELMMKVGMQKQAQYDQGVQKIQSYYDSIAGMDVIKGPHKEYLQSKLNQLGGNLNKFAVADFSNQQVVNSVSGMATQVARDPIILNGVYDTARIRKDQKQIEEDRKSGNYNPANEAVYNKKLGSWLNDGSLESPLNTRYDRYFDWHKFVAEEFNKLKPGNLSFDQVYQTQNGKIVMQEIKDAKGKVIRTEPVLSPYMLRYEKEGLFPQQVKSTLDYLLNDPRVSKQLGIEGEYNYQGVSGEDLSLRSIMQRKALLDNLDNDMRTLSLKKATGEDVENEILELEKRRENINLEYDQFSEFALRNPDGAKAKLYKDGIINDLTSMYGGLKTNKTTALSSPAYDARFKELQEANNIKYRKDTLGQAWQIAVMDRNTKISEGALNRNNALLMKVIGSKKGAGLDIEDLDFNGDGTPDVDPSMLALLGAGGPGGGGYNKPEQDEQPSGLNALSVFEKNYEAKAAGLTDASDKLIWQSMFENSPTEMAKLKKVMANGRTKEEAIKILLDNATPQGSTPEEFRTGLTEKAMGIFNRLSPEKKQKQHILADAVNRYEIASKSFGLQKETRDQILEETKTIVGEDVMKESALSNLKPLDFNYQDKKYTLTPRQQFDLALYSKGNESILGFLIDEGVKKAGEEAGRRLSGEGLGFLLDEARIATGNQRLSSLNDVKRDNITGSRFDIPNRAFQTGKAIWRANMNVFSKVMGKGSIISDLDWPMIKKVMEKIDDKVLSKTYETQSNLINQYYSVYPNLKQGLLTGDAETDRQSLYTLRRFAATYTTAEKNLSSDFDEFAKSIGDKDFLDNGGIIETKIIRDSNNEPLVEIVASTPAGGRQGGMTVSMDEAKKIPGISLDKLYEPEHIKDLKQLIDKNGGQSTPNNPLDSSTFYTGKNTYTNNDMPAMRGTPYDVKANIVKSNGLYYGVYLVQDGDEIVPRQTRGYTNLEKLDAGIRKTSPLYIQEIIKTK